jgi:hypothetical protein
MGPVSDEAKWFTIFFIIVGIVVIAGALGIIGRFFIDQANKRKQQQQKDIEKAAMEVGRELKSTLTPRISKDSSSGSPRKTSKDSSPGSSGSTATLQKEEAATLKEELAKLIGASSLSQEETLEVLTQLQQEQEAKPKITGNAQHSVPPLASVKLPPLDKPNAEAASASKATDAVGGPSNNTIEAQKPCANHHHHLQTATVPSALKPQPVATSSSESSPSNVSQFSLLLCICLCPP